MSAGPCAQHAAPLHEAGAERISAGGEVRESRAAELCSAPATGRQIADIKLRGSRLPQLRLFSTF